MPTKVNPIPGGYHSLTPFLCVRDAVRALEFYKKVFGAIELERHDEPSGKVSMARRRPLRWRVEDECCGAAAR